MTWFYHKGILCMHTKGKHIIYFRNPYKTIVMPCLKIYKAGAIWNGICHVLNIKKQDYEVFIISFSAAVVSVLH